MEAHKNRHGEAILMSTYNIGFYEDLTKNIFRLSSNFIKYAPYLLDEDFSKTEALLAKIPNPEAVSKQREAWFKMMRKTFMTRPAHISMFSLGKHLCNPKAISSLCNSFILKQIHRWRVFHFNFSHIL